MVDLGEAFEPRGEVHHVADHRVVHLLLGADVPDGDHAVVDADADAEGRPSRSAAAAR